MFSLSDALPMQSYPSNSKVWVLCQGGRADLCAYLFSFTDIIFYMKSVVYIMANSNTLKMLTS